MTSIVFHILSSAGIDARLRYACQLIDALREQDRTVFARVASDADARRLDETLWTFRDQAFIPHEIASAQSPSHPRVGVLIGTDAAPVSTAQVLINLADDSPATVGQYEELAEVVDADDQHKKLARERYRQYREQGFKLETINV